jgi:polar amino acid transport system substrate-binding protein
MNTANFSASVDARSALVSRRQALVRGAAALGGCASWLTLAGCASTDQAPAPGTAPTGSTVPKGAAGILRVGVCAKLPPIVSKSGGTFTGFEVDFAKGLAESMGRQVEFVDLPWADLLTALQSGRLDIVMSGMSITPERMMVVDFVKAYLRSGLAMVARRSEVATMSLFFNKMVRIGVKPGTTGQYFAQSQFPQNPCTSYVNLADAAKAMQAKKLDLFIIDAPIAWWMAGQHEAAGITVMGDLLNTEYLAWAIAKGNTELLTTANDYLAASTKNGQQQEILRRWLGAFYRP